MSLGYQNRLEGDMIVEGLRCAELEPVFQKITYFNLFPGMFTVISTFELNF